jgi:cell division protein ZapA (FtsZ GTPase activity inhibitor)
MLQEDQSAKINLDIDVLGTFVSIAVEEEPEYLSELLRFYRSKINSVQKSSKLKDPLKIAILTGFILCDELQKKHNEIRVQSVADKEAEHIAVNLAARIDAFFDDTGT